MPGHGKPIHRPRPRAAARSPGPPRSRHSAETADAAAPGRTARGTQLGQLTRPGLPRSRHSATPLTRPGLHCRPFCHRCPACHRLRALRGVTQRPPPCAASAGLAGPSVPCEAVIPDAASSQPGGSLLRHDLSREERGTILRSPDEPTRRQAPTGKDHSLRLRLVASGLRRVPLGLRRVASALRPAMPGLRQGTGSPGRRPGTGRPGRRCPRCSRCDGGVARS